MEQIVLICKRLPNARWQCVAHALAISYFIQYFVDLVCLRRLSILCLKRMGKEDLHTVFAVYYITLFLYDNDREFGETENGM
jgi:hypothetical protein